MVKWKGYTVGENTWERLENLKNAMEKIEEFEKGRFEEEIQRIRMKKGKEMKLNLKAEEFRRGELPGKYTAKLLYGWCYETLWTWTIFIFFFFYFLTL